MSLTLDTIAPLQRLKNTYLMSNCQLCNVGDLFAEFSLDEQYPRFLYSHNNP